MVGHHIVLRFTKSAASLDQLTRYRTGCFRTFSARRWMRWWAQQMGPGL